MKPEDFFNIVPSPEAFQFRGLNIYRVFYVHLTVKSQQNEGQTVQSTGRKPSTSLSVGQILRTMPRFLAALVRLFWLGVLKPRPAPILLYKQGGRHSLMNGKLYDLYSPRIIESQGRARFVLYEDGQDDLRKVYTPDLVRADFSPLLAVLLVIVRLVLGKQIKVFVRRILMLYPNLSLDAKEGTKIVVRFYAQYWLSCFVLSALKPAQVLMMIHYTREGFIAACKKLGYPVTELMHGRITPDHAFYKLPTAYANPAGRALLPDRILVYGIYWKNILTQGNFLPAENIGVIGYYLQVPERKDAFLPDGRRLMLIATQFNIQEAFCDYIAFLKAHLDRREWLILIKPHTYEQAGVYDQLVDADFVEITSENIYTLLNRTDILISSYSTVLYEALRYRCTSFALYNQPYEASWQEFIDSGLFTALYPGQLPALEAQPRANVSDYFDEFHPEVIF